MLVLRTTVALSFLASPVPAQLADLQPGQNFATALEALGGGRSENLDLGDVDRDGDLDVVVGNGGDGSVQLNRLYLNAGGAQGGAAGTFLDVTATHLPDQVLEMTRDVELVDWDGDFDLDLFEANKSNNLWRVQRAYINQGGLQLGSVGTYQEGTDGFWGQLVSVAPNLEVGVQDGMGPFRFAEGSDADFADLDDDGDLDLFLGCPGWQHTGAHPSLVFLNDGAGRFDELWPWADPAADVTLVGLDYDLVDLDGDFDLDLVACDRSFTAGQSRIFRNNRAEDGWGSSPFTDVTQSALIDTFATQLGSSCYEVEYGDLDGDDDFDLWMVNYQGFEDRILINQGDLTFESSASAVVADPSTDELDVELLDYDGDGDLDVFAPNFSGTNHLYQSGLAEGLDLAGGLYHRTGTTLDGSQAPWAETPASVFGGISADAEAADMDGDGDPDLLLANVNNGNNLYWENVRGVPDTHAPRLLGLTVQGAKTDGSPTPIHVKVLDNASADLIALHDARLIWSVDGGPEACQPMLAQGGQQFRGVIPAGLTGAVSYRVEVSDRAGNSVVSATTSYPQSGGSPDVWLPVDCGTPGVAGRPLLVMQGSASGGQPVTLQLVDGAPASLSLLVASIASAPVLFKGGLLYPVPWDVELFLPTDAAGMVNLVLPWPAGLPVGQQTWFQCAIVDPLNPTGAALSNAVRGTQP